jgi:putrescine transport system substrate-binding protein
MWFDQMVIPADMPNVEAARTFLNFIMDAHGIQRRQLRQYASNEASQEFLVEA